jgi:Ran GTPase-activating protein (RanGAP) involved in mRNA processing and transport
MCHIVQTARRLTKLDLSWCRMLSRNSQYLILLEALASNMRLVDLNLSWNTLAGEAPKPITSRTNKGSPRALAQSETERPADAEPGHQELAATFLASIIKRNRRLQHLNLENTGITDTMMKILSSALRRAPSLLSIHLSNNPFLIGKGAE